MRRDINDSGGEERSVPVVEIQVERSQGIIESQREGEIEIYLVPV